MVCCPYPCLPNTPIVLPPPPACHLPPPAPQVLIHNGASSIGMACIRVALSRGCEVFTTVSSGKKKRALSK